jgi:hypothetical protein
VRLRRQNGGDAADAGERVFLKLRSAAIVGYHSTPIMPRPNSISREFPGVLDDLAEFTSSSGRWRARMPADRDKRLRAPGRNAPIPKKQRLCGIAGLQGARKAKNTCERAHERAEHDARPDHRGVIAR